MLELSFDLTNGTVRGSLNLAYASFDVSDWPAFCKLIGPDYTEEVVVGICHITGRIDIRASNEDAAWVEKALYETLIN